MVCGSSTAISEDSLTSAKREEGRHVSFSSEVKEELSRQDTSARHCRLAELAAIIGMCGDVCISAMERYRLRIHTENEDVYKRQGKGTGLAVLSGRFFPDSTDHRDRVCVPDGVAIWR